MVITQFGSYIAPMGGGYWASGFGILTYSSGNIRVFSKGAFGNNVGLGVTFGTPFNLKYGYDGTELYVEKDGVRQNTGAPSSQSSSITHILQLNQQTNLLHTGNYAIQKAKLTVNNAVVFDCDFNGSTSIRHGDTKFQAAVGGPVSLTRAGQDPVTVIKKSVLRFDGTNDFLSGVFNQTITGSSIFMAYSVVGEGGEGNARLLGLNSTGANDNVAGGYFLARDGSTTNVMARYNGGTNIVIHAAMYDDAVGDVLLEANIKNGSQISKLNNANQANGTTTVSGDLSSEEFKIACFTGGDPNVAIDLEFLALFPATITDAQADSVRNYINNRNNVFSLIDSQGYYFFDGAATVNNQVFSGSSSWLGRIIGSDNDDPFKYLSNGSVNDRPTTDGYKITFADNSDHFLFNTPLSNGLAGWQVVGTSLGTFAYRVNANAVTELNLLGNLGSTAQRKAGDLYGVMLLPESATGADIESARRLLIDRGSLDGVAGNFFAAWNNRTDIVEFKAPSMRAVTDFKSAWNSCTNLTTFSGAVELGTGVSGVDFSYAFYNATSLVSLPSLDASTGTNFTSAFQQTTALTSFPTGAKLGTAASNVNFTSAWRSSGLTSFPSNIDLSKGTTFTNTWRQSGLTSFPAIQSTQNGTMFLNAWYNCASMTSFGNANLDKGGMFQSAWQACYNLEDFPALFTNWNPSSISSGVFNVAWDACDKLTAQSVENILTSIDASGKYATVYGTSGSAALADAGIDIDYNTATGSLSAATNTAIDSLSGKGWEVYINNVLVIPNILDLAPAAAYSLRSFDSAADPNVVNVRRSSDNATSNFKASEVSDGTLVAFVGAGNDGHVTTWYDQGGTNHAAQATASSQPKIVDAGTLVTEGGQAAVDFDGANDSFSIPSGLLSNLDTMLISVVLTNSDGNNDYGVVLGEPNTRIYVPYVSSSQLSIGYADSAVKLQDGAYSNGLQLITLSVDSSTASGFKNGQAFSSVATAAASNNAPTVTSNANRIGSFGGLAGAFDFSEVVIFNTDQSANRTGIEKNINDHFDIYS